jgi:hypothetical protein
MHVSPQQSDAVDGERRCEAMPRRATAFGRVYARASSANAVPSVGARGDAHISTLP